MHTYVHTHVHTYICMVQLGYKVRTYIGNTLALRAHTLHKGCA